MTDTTQHNTFSITDAQKDLNVLTPDDMNDRATDDPTYLAIGGLNGFLDDLRNGYLPKDFVPANQNEPSEHLDDLTDPATITDEELDRVLAPVGWGNEPKLPQLSLRRYLPVSVYNLTPGCAYQVDDDVMVVLHKLLDHDSETVHLFVRLASDVTPGKTYAPKFHFADRVQLVGVVSRPDDWEDNNYGV